MTPDRRPAPGDLPPEELAPRDMSPTTCPEAHAPQDMPSTTCPEAHAPQDMSLATCPADQAPAAPDPAPALAALARLTSFVRAGDLQIGLHPVLRTVALVTWAALSGACGDQAADPVRAAQAFTGAVQRGDMKAVLPLLETAAATRLEQAAEQASDQVGGRRRVEPAEMLQIVDVPPTFELAQAQLVDNDGATAHVRLVGAQQESYTLTLVLEDGAWHVRIPTPSP